MSWDAAADVVTVIGLPIALAGIFFVWRQSKADSLTASANAVAVVSASIREQLISIAPIGLKKGQDSPEWTNAFRDILNEIELACALYLDGQFHGRTGELARGFIADLLKGMQNDPTLSAKLAEAIDKPDTFSNIRAFLKKTRH